GDAAGEPGAADAGSGAGDPGAVRIADGGRTGRAAGEERSGKEAVGTAAQAGAAAAVIYAAAAVVPWSPAGPARGVSHAAGAAAGRRAQRVGDGGGVRRCDRAAREPADMLRAAGRRAVSADRCSG